MTPTSRTHYTLTIRAEPDGPDTLGRLPAERVRGLLKVMLRAFGLRCVSITTAERNTETK